MHHPTTTQGLGAIAPVDPLTLLMTFIIVLGAGVAHYLLASGTRIRGDEATVRSPEDDLGPAVWSDEVAVQPPEQRFEPNPSPRQAPYRRVPVARQHPAGDAAQAVLRYLLALPDETMRDGLDKRGCHIDCTQSALARQTGYSKSTINAAIHKLHRDGLLVVHTWARSTSITLQHGAASEDERLEAA
jgi:hypothetical protein